ncbi:MAG TPA: hypothetical protein VN890_10925 [Methylocella sp.]|nr:hypothetical protein [Methylocella sp.]
MGKNATAPCLHNGSVPTLYDLLLPPSDRPTSFYAGTREFDPVKVGFKTEQSAENSFLFRVFDAQGKPIQETSIPVTITTTPAYQRAIMQRSSNI